MRAFIYMKQYHVQYSAVTGLRLHVTMKAIYLLTLLAFTSYEIDMANCLQDFGFNLLRLKRKWVNGHLEVTAKIQAPTDAEFIWSFEFDNFPVLENDRFSSVESWRRNETIFTRLHTTRVNEGVIRLKAWAFRPYFMGIEIYVRNYKKRAVKRYTNKCKYSAPVHVRNGSDSAIQVKFDCGIYKGQDISDISTGIYYRAEVVSKSGDEGRIIDSWVSKDKQLMINDGQSFVIKTIKQNNSWIADQGGILGMFRMTQSAHYKDKGPLFDLDYILEDDKSFDGKRNNPFLPNVFSEVYFTVNHLKLMASRRQAYIHCRAIGYKIPEVQVYKQAENGSLMTLTHPKIALNTRFSSSLHYIINYPTEQDAGSYVCVSKVDGEKKMYNVTSYFEPPLPPEILEEDTGRVYRYYEESIKVKVKVPEEVNITCFMGSKFGKKIDSKPLKLSRTQKDLTLVVDYYVPWPNSRQWRGILRKKVFCQAENIYGEVWTEIGKKRRLPKMSK